MTPVRAGWPEIAWRARVTACLIAAATAIGAAQPAQPEWPQWRGPFNTGMARGTAPLKWDDGTNVRWRIAIPGRGHSTPVVAGPLMFLTTAVPTGKRTVTQSGGGRAGGGADAGLEHRFEVIATNRTTGQRRMWRGTTDDGRSS